MLTLLTPITLLENEEVIFRTKKHWILFFQPALFLLVAFFFTTNNTITHGIEEGLYTLFQFSSFSSLAKKIPLVLFLFLFMVTALQQWLTYATSDFVITNKRIIMRQGFFNRYVRDMRLSTITLVSIEQDLLGQFVDYGTIVIQSFGATDYFAKIAQPKKFQFNLQQEIDKNASR